MLCLEAYTMKENIILSGVEERKDETEQQLLAAIRSILDDTVAER